eukprot:m.117598 g.117598  ORF g.117598 m.117598 type:complete len:85 (+) comp51974_c0_seq19:867-1121(+)
MLEFSSLGFVAKLFRDHTVAQLAAFFKEFYREHPVDFLLQYYLQLLDGESVLHSEILSISLILSSLCLSVCFSGCTVNLFRVSQ